MTTSTPARPQYEVVRDIRRFLLSADALPKPQGTVLKLIEAARNPDASIDDVAVILKSDPALSAFVLRAAATARFHTMRGSLNLNTAVQRLGLYAIRAYAVVLSLIALPDRMQCEGFNYHRFWVGSLHTGILTESLSEKSLGRAADDSFALGLLSGIGALVFATAEPDEYARLLSFGRKSGTDIETLEREVFGFDHDELSAVLMTDWELPTSMADIVYWQCDPEGGGFSPGSTPHLLASNLRLAHSLSCHVFDRLDDGDALVTARRRAEALGIEPAELQELLAASMTALREWTYLVGLPMPLVDAARLRIAR